MLFEREEYIRAPLVDALDRRAHGATEIRRHLFTGIRLTPLRFGSDANDVLLLLQLNQ